MTFLERTYLAVTRGLGRLSGRYYFEDYVRVYPDGDVRNRLGIRKAAGQHELNNYLNHRKFYRFAGQFVAGRRVADVGCGSGYGCEMLREAGASHVAGCDISGHAVEFARRRFPGVAEFRVQGITDLHGYGDASFDVAISSEVLEHIKDYGMEDRAVAELRRITRPGGLVVVGTPNIEVSADHGFTWDEIDGLFRRHFAEYVVFENLVIPNTAARTAWERRRAEDRVGQVVSVAVDLAETVLPEGAIAEVKQGTEPGEYRLGGYRIDTSLLHNTHSWVAVAVRGS